MAFWSASVVIPSMKFTNTPYNSVTVPENVVVRSKQHSLKISKHFYNNFKFLTKRPADYFKKYRKEIPMNKALIPRSCQLKLEEFEVSIAKPVLSDKVSKCLVHERTQNVMF